MRAVRLRTDGAAPEKDDSPRPVCDWLSMAKLSSAQIKSALVAVPNWKREGRSIVRLFKFKDFIVAVRFVNAVAKLAEKAAHHPDIDIRWNKVSLVFTTHDAGGLTEKDFTLAAKCDAASAKL